MYPCSSYLDGVSSHYGRVINGAFLEVYNPNYAILIWLDEMSPWTLCVLMVRIPFLFQLHVMPSVTVGVSVALESPRAFHMQVDACALSLRNNYRSSTRAVCLRRRDCCPMSQTGDPHSAERQNNPLSPTLIECLVLTTSAE